MQERLDTITAFSRPSEIDINTDSAKDDPVTSSTSSTARSSRQTRTAATEGLCRNYLPADEGQHGACTGWSLRVSSVITGAIAWLVWEHMT
jgi:hypothetical protein